MDLTVELTVEYTRTETGVDDPLPFKLKAEVIQNAFIEQEIFLYQRVITLPADPVDEFVGLAGPTEMISYPADTPDAGNPFFRKKEVELEFASGIAREDVIAQLRVDAAKLAKDYQLSSQSLEPSLQEQYLGE